MLDFLIVSDRQVNKGTAIEIYPKFAVYGQCSDLMKIQNAGAQMKKQLFG